MSARFQNKIAVVTGAGSVGPGWGNGRAIAVALVREGAHVVALDMKTGKQLWKKPFANHLEGYKGVSAPLIANGVMITGTSGGEHATRDQPTLDQELQS